MSEINSIELHVDSPFVTFSRRMICLLSCFVDLIKKYSHINGYQSCLYFSAKCKWIHHYFWMFQFPIEFLTNAFNGIDHFCLMLTFYSVYVISSITFSNWVHVNRTEPNKNKSDGVIHFQKYTRRYKFSTLTYWLFHLNSYWYGSNSNVQSILELFNISISRYMCIRKKYILYTRKKSTSSILETKIYVQYK